MLSAYTAQLATFLVLSKEKKMDQVNSIEDAMSKDYKICLLDVPESTVARLNPSAKPYLRPMPRDEVLDHFLDTSEAAVCQAALIDEAAMYKYNEEGVACGMYRSDVPVFVQPYGVPMSSRVSKSLSVAFRYQYSAWLSILKDKRPRSICTEQQASEVQSARISPLHCGGILLVTAVFMILSTVSFAWMQGKGNFTCRGKGNLKVATFTAATPHNKANLEIESERNGPIEDAGKKYPSPLHNRIESLERLLADELAQIKASINHNTDSDIKHVHEEGHRQRVDPP